MLREYNHLCLTLLFNLCGYLISLLLQNRSVIGFDIDPESLETATLNAEELEVFLKFFFFYVNEFSFGCIANTIAIIGLFCRSR